MKQKDQNFNIFLCEALKQKLDHRKEHRRRHRLKQVKVQKTVQYVFDPSLIRLLSRVSINHRVPECLQNSGKEVCAVQSVNSRNEHTVDRQQLVHLLLRVDHEP